jgi:regulator of nucleoside diphosphate kinase
MENLIISNLDYSRIRMRMALNQNKDSHTLGDVEKRISDLDKAVIIEPSEIPEDVVTMHSKVLIRDLNHNKTHKVQLVYPEDADHSMNRISIFSPIATAVLGNKVGDIVDWNTSDGNIKIKIECILYQPEALGDYHL